jgi:hypothetical protein
MKPITYSLNSAEAPYFYGQLEDFTNKILSESAYFIDKNISSFTNFISEKGIEIVRSPEEYTVEFISIGVFIERYSAYALKSNKLSISLLHKLYLMRGKSESLKPYVDNVRGYLSAKLLYVESKQNIDYSLATFIRLLQWMDATGEFKEEVIRLEKWVQYLKTIDSDSSRTFIRKAISFARNFEEQAKYYLGVYTQNVDSFLNTVHNTYREREDYLFCGSSEVEYHLNMFGAEVINRNLKEHFVNTQNKVLLLPTCMCKPSGEKCKTKIDGLSLKCTSCSDECNVKQIKNIMQEQNVDVHLIPHSSSFSKFLQVWKNQDETGVIGVACVMNLLKGGYELQRLNIPSQCVFLNECGCKKHWDNVGIPTNMDTKQLKYIVSQGKINRVLDSKKLVSELMVE